MNSDTRTSNVVLIALLLGLLAYISISLCAEATFEERRRLLIYAVLFACAVFATSLPSALIPDPLLGTQQLFNTSPSKLLANQIKRWRPWILSVCAPILLIGFVDLHHVDEEIPLKGLWVASHLLTVAGIGLYSLCVYFSIGPTSQQWQEGTKGGWWDKLIELNPTLRPSVPRGLLPALSSTTRVFGVAILVTMLSVILERDVSPLLMPLPGLIMLGWSLRKIRLLRPHFDRFYYHTNAFYGEVLRTGSFTSEVKETTPYKGLYWVPMRWRPHTWASLVQLERVIPIGRFVVIAITFLWILSWRNASVETLTAYLTLVLVGKNLCILFFNRKDLAASLLTHAMQSTLGWSITRGFVNLKWTLSLAVGLLPLTWLDSSVSWQFGLTWVLADMLCSFIFALFITYGSKRNAFA